MKSVSEDQVTLSWLVKHVPVSWLLSGFFMLSASFALGYQVKSALIVNAAVPTAEEIIQLAKQKSSLESEIASLKGQIFRLKIDKELQQMSDEELIQRLKKDSK